MSSIIAYDRDWVVQCFRRNLEELARPGNQSRNGITSLEVNYVAERMAETCIFGRSDHVGNPWLEKDEAEELVKLPSAAVTRAKNLRCELLANSVLVFEGIVGRGGALDSMHPEREKLRWKKVRDAEALYAKASLGTFRSVRERVVLEAMSGHVSAWIGYLSEFPGRDAAALEKQRKSFYLHLPS